MLTTELANLLSTNAYPLRHAIAFDSPDLRDRDSDLNTTLDGATHILVTGPANRMFTGQRDDFRSSTLVGRIVRVRPSRPTGEQWYMSEDHNPLGTGGAYLTGARVNPNPRNGGLYQELRSIGGGPDVASPFVLRYNDDAHAEERAVRTNPWTIVWATENLRSEIGRQRVQPPTGWIELASPLTPVTTGLASDEDIDSLLTDEEVPAPAPTEGIANLATGHTLGKGHVETEGGHVGMVLLNPARTVGEMYLTWYPNRDYYNDHVFVQVYHGGERFAPVGYFNRGRDGRVYYTDDVFSVPPMPAGERNIQWAKLAMEVPDESPEATAREAALVEQARASHEAFEDLNDALNEMAEEQSWCSEYERTMQYIQMRDRRSGNRQPYDPGNPLATTQRRAWDLEYTVDISVESDDPGYRVIDRLDSEYGVALQNVSLTFTASVSVTVTQVAATAEEAEDMVGSPEIEERLSEMFDGSFSMDDWTHNDTSENTDFDWDEWNDNQ
jgi:hypothetical protein